MAIILDRSCHSQLSKHLASGHVVTKAWARHIGLADGFAIEQIAEDWAGLLRHERW